MGERDAISPSVSLYVSGLHPTIRPDDLRDLFGKYGKVLDVYIPLDYHTRRQRGFAYIQFDTVYDAEEAKYYLDNTRLAGRFIEVQFAAGDRKSSTMMRRMDPRFPYRASYRRSRSRSLDRSRRRRSRSSSYQRYRSRRIRRSTSRGPSADREAEKSRRSRRSSSKSRSGNHSS